MFPTKFVLLLVAVLAVQISSRAVHSISPGEAILRGLEQATASLDFQLHDSERIIQDAQPKVEELKESTLSLASKSIKSFIEPLLKNLEDLKEKADKAGIDISDCSESKEDELRKLPAQTLLKIETCLNNSETAVFKEAQNTYDSLKAANDRLKELTVEIGECNDHYWFQFTKCLHDAEEVFKILFRVATQNTDAENTISSVRYHARQKFEQCTSNASEGYNKEAKALSNQISQCIEGKLNPVTVNSL